MTRRQRLYGGLTGALVLALALGLAADRWLWPTTVPAGLHTPQLDVHRFFGSGFLARSAAYDRFLEVDALLAQLVLLAVLVLYALRGHRFTRQSAAGPIGTGMLLGMLGFGLVWIAQLPFGWAALWWERRHHVSHQAYLTWTLQSFAQLGGRFLFICLALLIAMGLARALKGWWWLAAAPLFGGLALLSAFLTIYLTPSVHPLRDRALLAHAAALAKTEGVAGTKVEVQDVSRFTTSPNAETVGFGPTRRVILWDTLLGGGFGRTEVDAVVAHELGHVAHDHVLKGVAWLAMFLLPIAAILALAVRGHGGMGRPEAVPVALLAFVVLSLLATPLRNVISRRMEAEADWSALQATRDPAGYRAAFRKLAVKSLDDPDPPAWVYVLGATHPTIAQRLAMADAWEARQLGRSGRSAASNASPGA